MTTTTNTTNESRTLPAGQYWIGDPCYAFDDHGLWMELLESADYTGPQRILEADARGQSFTASGTAFGDGTYEDRQGNEYGVDAGLLGAVPVPPGSECVACPRGMREVYIGEPFTVSYEEEGGIVRIGDIEIATDPTDFCGSIRCHERIEPGEDYCDSCLYEIEEAEEEEDW